MFSGSKLRCCCHYCFDSGTQGPSEEGGSAPRLDEHGGSCLISLPSIFISVLWRTGRAFQFVEAHCVCHLKLSGTIKAQLIIIKHFNDTYLGGSRSASETTVPTAAACIQGKSPRKLAESSSDLLCSMKRPRAAAGLPQGRLLCLQPLSEVPGLWLLIRITDPQWALVSLLCGSAGDGAGGLLHFSVPLSPLYKYLCKLPSMFPSPCMAYLAPCLIPQRVIP